VKKTEKHVEMIRKKYRRTIENMSHDLKVAIEGNNKDPELFYMMSDLFGVKGDDDKSEAYLKMAHQYYDEMYIEGQDLSLEKKTDEAMYIFKRLSKINPYDSDPIYNISTIYYFRSDYNKALYYINKAMQLKRNNELYISFKGHIYYQMGEYEKALIFLNKALDISPVEVSTNICIGDTYVMMKMYEKAVKYYSTAYELERSEDNFYKLFDCLIRIRQSFEKKKVESQKSARRK